jgi:hypothetical protein
MKILTAYPDKHNISGVKTHQHHTTISAISHAKELDLHADTCSFGCNAYIVCNTGETINVSGFIDSLGTVKRVPIVTAAVVYDDPVTCQTYILFFHQAIL